ncbi:MAG: hypothetical protein R3A10_11465 [Caldilineaceae bacterium]
MGLALEPTRPSGTRQRRGPRNAGHGYRPIDYATMDEDEERRHIRALTCEVIERVRAAVPWLVHRAHQREHVARCARMGPLYLSDFYNDDLPYWLPGAAATGHPVHAGQQRCAT